MGMNREIRGVDRSAEYRREGIKRKEVAFRIGGHALARPTAGERESVAATSCVRRKGMEGASMLESAANLSEAAMAERNVSRGGGLALDGRMCGARVDVVAALSVSGPRKTVEDTNVVDQRGDTSREAYQWRGERNELSAFQTHQNRIQLG